MLHVTKLLRRIEGPATHPFEGIVEDKHAFIKTPNGNWGNKILVNEYVCLRLAQKLSIPIPNGGICCIDEKTDIDEVEEEIDYDETFKGVCFFSERIEKGNPFVKSLEIVKHIVNKSEINKIVLFDHIIYNKDRHEANILLHQSKNINGFHMYVIDHSHVFNLRHIWDSKGFFEVMKKEDFKNTEIMEANNEAVYRFFFELGILDKRMLETEAEIFKNIINRDAISNICKDIPKAWKINQEDIEALINYILYRVNNIKYIVELILSYRDGGV